MMDKIRFRVPRPDKAKEKLSPRKKEIRRILAVMIAAAIALAVILYTQTYTTMKVTDTYTISSAADSSYQAFSDGVLKYSRDGVSYLNHRGEEQWNRSCQMQNPVLAVNDSCAAAADEGGTTILVLEEEGIKGEITTTLPIEKVAVSQQGIVGAILKNETTPMIFCYDSEGNVLVEQKATFAGTGYPVDLALSDDGETMQVLYLTTDGGTIRSRVVYYNFGSAGEKADDYQIFSKDYDDCVLAEGFYMKGGVSAAVGDHSISFFKGTESVAEATTLELEKDIQSICHDESYIGLVLKNEGGGYEIRMYNTSGKQVMSRECEETYGSVSLSGSNLILYDGGKCRIYTRTGRLRFEGEYENTILGLYRVFGLNKYILMDANGMETVRLIK